MIYKIFIKLGVKVHDNVHDNVPHKFVMNFIKIYFQKCEEKINIVFVYVSDKSVIIIVTLSIVIKNLYIAFLVCP